VPNSGNCDIVLWAMMSMTCHLETCYPAFRSIQQDQTKNIPELRQNCWSLSTVPQSIFPSATLTAAVAADSNIQLLRDATKRVNLKLQQWVQNRQEKIGDNRKVQLLEMLA